MFSKYRKSRGDKKAYGCVAGMAILETSLILSVVTALLLGVLAVIEYTRSVALVQAAVDRHLFDSGLKPLRLISSNGSLDVSPVESSLEDFLESAVLHIEEEVLRIDARGIGEEKYRIQGYWSLLSFTEEGSPDLEKMTVTAPGVFAGRMSVRQALGAMKQEFASLVDGDGFVLESAPTGAYGLGGMERLPNAVLVGVQAFVDLDDGFIGNALRVLGLDSIISVNKAIALRGELS